jgi:negative regulator of flagellin synthesis FlgM
LIYLPQVDQIALSDSVVKAIEGSKFDAAKVEALRLAIMEGNYPLDAKRIAENMVDLERMINS